MSETSNTTTTNPGKTPAWFIVFTCGCHDVRVDQDALPDVCPGHGTEPILDAEPLDVLDEFVGVHDCGDTVSCDPTPVHQWEVTTPAEVYATGDELGEGDYR